MKIRNGPPTKVSPVEEAMVELYLEHMKRHGQPMPENVDTFSHRKVPQDFKEHWKDIVIEANKVAREWISRRKKEYKGTRRALDVGTHEQEAHVEEMVQELLRRIRARSSLENVDTAEQARLYEFLIRIVMQVRLDALDYFRIRRTIYEDGAL